LLIDLGAADLMRVGCGEDPCAVILVIPCTSLRRASTTDLLAGSETGSEVEGTFTATLDCNAVPVLQASHHDFVTCRTLWKLLFSAIVEASHHDFVTCRTL
jgi:hypothetical protein